MIYNFIGHVYEDHNLFQIIELNSRIDLQKVQFLAFTFNFSGKKKVQSLNSFYPMKWSPIKIFLWSMLFKFSISSNEAKFSLSLSLSLLQNSNKNHKRFFFVLQHSLLQFPLINIHEQGTYQTWVSVF